MPVTLQTPIEQLGFVAKRISRHLKKLGLNTASDLLEYYPFRYEDFSQVVPINEIKIGQEVTVKGRIFSIENKRTPKKFMNITEAWIGDGESFIKAIWFNQPYLVKSLPQGEEIAIAGRVTQDSKTKEPVMLSPVYETLSETSTHTGRIVPIYPLTEGISQKQIRTVVKLALGSAGEIKEFLPCQTLEKNNFLPRSSCVRIIHFPPNKEILGDARKRLQFEELFIIQLLNQRKSRYLHHKKSHAVKTGEERINFLSSFLPFNLTKGQQKALKEILSDISRATPPMNRLLEGDVGSGKTCVAALAMVETALSGFQSALMAPTEILAQQHFQNFKKWFSSALPQIDIALLTGKQSQLLNVEKISKKELKEKIKNGFVKIVIGTHALLTEDVEFPKLALSVIDEQHRFGVTQRKTIKEKTSRTEIAPHLLSLTATPIPRSLALTLYGDLDLSQLDEKPMNRQEVITTFVENGQREQMYTFARKQIAQGRQVFVICPLIEESDALGVKSATMEYELLKENVFKNEKVGLLHGQMKSNKKQAVMEDFQNGITQVLVSTPVIEVGVDVPNAAIMIIEGAERFGLAQLHQFRGRVGRGQNQSYCFLCTESFSSSTRQRLNYMIGHNNGFELAEYDLKTRGPGEIYGSRQSGFLPNLKIADFSDIELIKQARMEAETLLQNSPDLLLFPELKYRLDSWEANQHFE